jgi:hypothetical protein
MKAIAYEALPFLPYLIAETICEQEYKMQEFSEGMRSEKDIAPVEEKRKAMTFEQIREFGTQCDARCRAAYTAKAKWFMDCVNAKANYGRDQLYVWLRHWMVAYLTTGKV